MEEMGVGNHSRALIAKAWSVSKTRARLANKTSEPVNLERGLPQGAPESPIIFAMILKCVVRRCEEKWAVKGLGFLVRWNEMGECNLCRRHFSHQREETRSGELEAVGLGLGSKQNTLVILPCKAWRGAARWLRTDTVGANVGFVGMVLDLSGSSWAAVRNRLNQGAVSLNGKTKLNLMVTSV